MEVCDEKHKAIGERFTRDEDDIRETKKDIDGINLKITSTLVFVIVTLATLVTAIILRLL